MVTAPCSRQLTVASSMGLPLASLTFPDNVKCCACTVSVRSVKTNVNVYFFAFIVSNNATAPFLLCEGLRECYTLHSHDAKALTHLMLMRNHRYVLTSLPPKRRMKSR